ncbi:MAG TPA: glycosyltransferase family 39 protein [Xanthobacteraceae bacterium]|jgi:4-amino-4-deoxy-L-arabinose transferase-like glycosyltransferase|nr:glycosyltransferase family 39 protein [Xanthobacteraceae bacterium]
MMPEWPAMAAQGRPFAAPGSRLDAGPDRAGAMIAALLDRLQKRPGEGFALFCLVHAALWTLLPATLYPNLPLDLIEALTYGREWQLGYDKLPPLPWWLIEGVYRLFGADTAFYLVAQMTVLAAFWLVWLLARRLVGPLGALIAVLIVDGLHYFNFTAPKFNHDVIQLPFWALAGVSFHGALRRGGLRDWVGLGLACGLALWAKYFIVILALPLALFLLLDRDARRALRTPGPYVAVLVGLAVALPHLVWLVQNDFLPFRYADARAAPTRGLLDHLVHPVVFVAGQILWLLPSGLIALPLIRPRVREPKAAVDAFDYRIVTLLAFGPAALLIAGSLVSGRGLIAMWGYPLWLFLGLWFVLTAGPAIEWARARRVVLAWGAVTALYAIAFVAQYGVLPFVDHRYRASLFPGDRLGAEISARFRAATGAPLAYVIGSMWLGGNISRYSAERPRTLIDAKPERAPWIDLADLKRRGAVVVWTDGDRGKVPEAYARFAADAQVQPPITLPMRWGSNGEMLFGWAIVPPAP